MHDGTPMVHALQDGQLRLRLGVNHVLKIPAGEDRGANLATYADPSLPIAPSVIDAVAGFVRP